MTGSILVMGDGAAVDVNQSSGGVSLRLFQYSGIKAQDYDTTPVLTTLLFNPPVGMNIEQKATHFDPVTYYPDRFGIPLILVSVLAIGLFLSRKRVGRLLRK